MKNLRRQEQKGVFEKKENEKEGNIDKMLNILDNIIEQKNVKKFKKFRSGQLKVEKKVDIVSKYEESLKRLLEIYGVKDLKIIKIGENLFEIPLKKNDIEELEYGYGFKGGKARNILEYKLGFQKIMPARDVDLVKYIENDDSEKDDVMALKYSPEDFKNGYGIERLENNYFDSRDFTINELLVAHNKIVLTKNCLLDTARGIIRFSEYEKKELFNRRGNFESVENNEKTTYLEKYKEEKSKNKKRFFVNDKLMAKALRLFVNQLDRRHAKIADEEVYSYLDINNFHIALHLDRALGQSYDVAMKYIKKLIDLGQIEANYENDPEKVLLDFVKMIKEEDSFIFRNEALKTLNEEQKELNDLDRFIKMARNAVKLKHIKNIEDYL